MSSITSVVFTVIGGLVAGGVGYLATIVSLREQRKQKYLEDHKNNLNAVIKALDQILGEVWIFVNGADNLNLPKPHFGNENRVANIQIKTVPIAMELKNSFSDDSRRIQMGIDATFYDDIPSHFSELNKLLKETEGEVKKNGMQILRLLNLLSTSIYERLWTRDIDFPNWSDNKSELKKFSWLKNESIESDFAGSIFLMVLCEDEANCPNKLWFLKQNKVYDKLKDLSEAIMRDFGDNLNQLIELHDRLFQRIDDTKSEIEKIYHKTKLKGEFNMFDDSVKSVLDVY